MGRMAQTAYSYACAPLTMSLLHVIALTVHVTVNPTTLEDSVISWVTDYSDQ